MKLSPRSLTVTLALVAVFGLSTFAATAQSHVPAMPKPLNAQSAADAILGDSLHQLKEWTDEHFHKGEYNHAINLSRIVVQGFPKDVEVYANAAYLLWSTTRNDEAIAFLKQGLAAVPNSYYMYDELGAHYWVRLKAPTDALPYYEQAIKFRCPAQTWHSLAHCYEKTGQWEKAVHAWEKAAEYPGDKVALVNLKRARAHLAPAPQNVPK